MDIKVTRELTKKIIDLMDGYIQKENYKGYDPIDIFNSYLPLKLFPGIIKAFFSQIHLRNPINLRPILGIKKDYNPMGLGILLEAYSLLYRINPTDYHKQTIDWLFNKLVDLRSREFKGYCWGNNFDWAGRDLFVPKNYPNIVTTTKGANGIFKYYKVTKNPEALNALKKVGDYLLEETLKIERPEGICFSYTDLKEEACYNANMLTSELLMKIHSINQNPNLKKFAKQSVEFTLTHQNNDGHWNYSIDLSTGIERRQIDFHQGYILMSLADYIKYSPENHSYNSYLAKGLNFYKQKQFFDNGRAKWRIPKIFPIETHHQAVGILTFAKLSKLDKSYPNFAVKIAEWTINHLFNDRGFFYFRINQIGKNKISFMRWTQAYMLLALATLYVTQTKK